MIRTIVPLNKNRQGFLYSFAYFCLDKYKEMLKECLFSNYLADGVRHENYQIKTEDGKFIDFYKFIDNLKVKFLPKKNMFIFYYFDPKDNKDLFRELYFSKKLEAQASCFQRATHIYNESYIKLLSLFYIEHLSKPRRAR
jgi:hypothetical protein